MPSPYSNARDVTETSNGSRAAEFGVAYAAGERIATEKMRLQSITVPRAGNVDVPAVVTPEGLALITAVLASPLVPSGVKVQAPESLVAYAQRFGSANTVLFVEDQPQPRLTLIIDYHEAADAGAEGAYHWARNRAVYEPLLTPEWQTWHAISGQRKSQTEFAQFLEDNLQDIAEPPGADILDIVRTLEVKKGVQFRSSVRLDNGETQLRYEEDIEGSAAKGQFQIPSRLLLGLRPYKGAARFEVVARFRYRLDGAVLKLGVDLDRPHKVLEHAVAETLADVAAKLPTVPLFWGPAPEALGWAPIVIKGT